MNCNHPVTDLKIWRVWTTYFKDAPNDLSKIQVLVECKCGYRGNLISQIGDDE